MPGRWNGAGKFVLYAAHSRSLASLENVVHRSSEGLDADFRVMVIYIPDTLKIKVVNLEELPANWKSDYPHCQKLGNTWIAEMGSAVLRVPSSIVPQEHCYLLNVAHPDFQQIKLTDTENFSFDSRIKASPA